MMRCNKFINPIYYNTTYSTASFTTPVRLSAVAWSCYTSFSPPYIVPNALSSSAITRNHDIILFSCMYGSWVEASSSTVGEFVPGPTSLIRCPREVPPGVRLPRGTIWEGKCHGIPYSVLSERNWRGIRSIYYPVESVGVNMWAGKGGYDWSQLCRYDALV